MCLVCTILKYTEDIFFRIFFGQLRETGKWGEREGKMSGKSPQLRLEGRPLQPYGVWSPVHTLS